MSKIKQVKKEANNVLDLSRDEDLVIGLMNLISLEEHFFFTYVKTNDDKYLDLLNSVRDMRKEMLAKVVINPVGEEWCISKHLLASSMRMMEVGTKELGRGKKEDSKKFFDSSFELFSLFFGLNNDLIKSKITEKTKKESFSKLKNFVTDMVDCCKE